MGKHTANADDFCIERECQRSFHSMSDPHVAVFEERVGSYFELKTKVWLDDLYVQLRAESDEHLHRYGTPLI